MLFNIISSTRVTESFISVIVDFSSISVTVASMILLLRKIVVWFSKSISRLFVRSTLPLIILQIFCPKTIQPSEREHQQTRRHIFHPTVNHVFSSSFSFCFLAVTHHARNPRVVHGTRPLDLSRDFTGFSPTSIISRDVLSFPLSPTSLSLSLFLSPLSSWIRPYSNSISYVPFSRRSAKWFSSVPIRTIGRFLANESYMVRPNQASIYISFSL